MINEEQVLVIDSNLLSGLNKDIINNDEDDIEYIFEECLPLARFIPRSLAEKSLEFKQIIPYGVIQNEDKILSYQRTKKSGESRLHDNFSIGFGGHINPEDKRDSNESFDIFANAFHRELNEELEWGDDTDQYSSKIECIINDNSNLVGQVHLGIVVLIQPYTIIKEKENTIDKLEWLSLDDFALFKYENWSQAVIKYLRNKK